MKQMMRWVVVSVVVVLAALRLAAATTLVLHPPSGAADGVLEDGVLDPASGNVEAVDGVFDAAVTTDAIMVAGGAQSDEPRRAVVVEFSVTAIPSGAHILSARLSLDDIGGGFTSAGVQNLQVFMYAGDGQVTVADATTTGVLVGAKTNVGSGGLFGPDPVDLDLAITPSLVESLLSAGATHIGFLITPDRVFSRASEDHFASSESTFPGALAPRLTIEYAIDGTLCATLGDDQPPSLLDQDIFRFTGTHGETVTLTLAADPAGAQTGEHATLLLTDQIARVFVLRHDSGALPNTVQATLPATGAYRVTVAEHPDLPPGSAFLGAYCVTLASSEQAWETFTTTATVEGLD